MFIVLYTGVQGHTLHVLRKTYADHKAAMAAANGLRNLNSSTRTWVRPVRDPRLEVAE
jgi:hypothetical protein